VARGWITYRWRKLAPLLANRGMRVVAVDMPGSGLSDKPTGEDYSPDTLAAVVASTVNVLGLRPAHVVRAPLPPCTTAPNTCTHRRPLPSATSREQHRCWPVGCVGPCGDTMGCNVSPAIDKRSSHGQLLRVDVYV
jgi:hypothetical protein